MKLLSVSQSINENNFSVNKYHKKVYKKYNSTQFCGGKIPSTTASNAIKDVNIDEIMQISGDLIKKFDTLIQRSKELKVKVSDIFKVLDVRINDILIENGFNPDKFNPGSLGRNSRQRSELANFFKLAKKLNAKPTERHHGITNFMSWAEAQFNKDAPLVVEHRINLKSKKHPDSILEVYAEHPKIDEGSVSLGVSSYKDKSHTLISDKRGKYDETNWFTIKTPELDIHAKFNECSGCRLTRRGRPIIDKENNVEFSYCHNSDFLDSIKSFNDNTTYDIDKHEIIQEFPDKTVVHKVWRNSILGIEFRKNK